ncbi:shikimate kinase [bacterium]|nr:shikimate kinase [bacterium]
MANNIVLVGLMGAGKSTIGKALAEKTGFKFIDIDEEIVVREKMSINEIFETKSETYFREVETQVLQEFSEKENLIISTGGGAFEKKVNRELLLTSCKVVYLQADVNTLFERIKNDTSRPLLKCENPRGKLEELLAKREKNYLKAHHKINTVDKSVDEIVEEIISATIDHILY